MLEIFGSYGEGGGQIIRSALSLSAVTKKAIYIHDIRAKREKGGLQPQHLMACLATSRVCNGNLKYAELHSDKLIFEPGEIAAGEYEFDIGTAGSTILVAQTLIPILLHAKENTTVRIIGGTHIIKSPGFDYFDKVFLSAIRKFNANVKAALVRPGYYPSGGGVIELSIMPSSLEGNLKWEKEKNTHGIIRLSNLPSHIAEREKKILEEHRIKDVAIFEESAFSPGNAVTLWSGFRGSYMLGERGKPAEKVAEEAVSLLQEEKEEIDCHLADQILLYAAMAKGETSYTTSHITEHFKTHQYVISKFYERAIKFEENKVVVTRKKKIV